MEGLTVKELQDVFNSASGINEDYSPNSIFSLARFEIVAGATPDDESIVKILDEFIGEDGVFQFYFDADTTMVDITFSGEVNADLLTVNQRLNNYLDTLKSMTDESVFSLNLNVFPKKYEGEVNISFSNPWYFGITENPGSLQSSKTVRFTFLNENVDVFSNVAT